MIDENMTEVGAAAERRALVATRAAQFLVLAVMGAALLAAGCAVGYTATVADDGYGPDLVYAAPGVQVIADYDEPVFFADSFYWRFSGGYWYRSPYYNRGWVSARPPSAVLSINRPQGYAHYRPQGWAPRGRPAPAPQARGRDDGARFQGRPAPRPVYQAAPPPRASPSGGWRGAPPPPPAMRAAPPPMRAAPPPPAARPRPSRGGEHHDRH